MAHQKNRATRQQGNVRSEVRAEGKASAAPQRSAAASTANSQGEVVKARPPRYDFHAFEEKWRAHWEESGIYRVDLRNAKRPYYNLMMFPYPSAEGLHVGNVYAFVGSDIHGRFMAAQGYDVFEPMGFDAFGIHSENFAIKQGMHPAVLTARNVERFRERQLKRIGNRFDWSHEVNTTDPQYYKWTQWIFTQLFNAGLAERKRAAVNWCPNDKTVLADEQVINGHCERCDALVERRELEQWFLKTTAYADQLLANLPALDWSERVKIAQRNWIGRSEGLEFAFKVQTPESNHTEHTERRESGRDAVGAETNVEDAETAEITVYTTRPDTIYGATFVVLAPEHPLVDTITTEGQRAAVDAYRRELVSRRAEEPGEKVVSGAFTGAYAVHPLTGGRLPIWIADYVLMEYGTGAIMAVPAHDARDLAFARAFGLSVRVVVEPNPLPPSFLGKGPQAEGESQRAGGVAGEGPANEFAPPGPPNEYAPERPAATESADADLEQTTPDATVGARHASRYGAAANEPMAVFTEAGVLVDSGPYTGMPSQEAAAAIVAAFEARGIGRRRVNYQMRDWLISRQRYWGPPIPIVYCPEHGAVAVPEEQLPVLLPPLEEYRPTATGNSPLAQIPEFVNTSCPICGKPARRETDVMDNFLDSGWYFLRYPSSDDAGEAWDPEITRKWLPVAMYIGGAEHSVLHLLYSRFLTMALHDLGKLPFEEPFAHFRAHGLIIKDGAKISKSRGNVINPDDYLETYGADVLRTYLMFMGPYEAGGDFSDRGIGGVVRFLDRVWRLANGALTTEHTELAESGETDDSDVDRAQGRQTPAKGSSSKEPVKESSSAPAAQPAVSAVVAPAGSAAMHATIKRVTEEIAALKYNTAIAGLMEYTNTLEAQATVSREELRTLVVLLAPFAPFLSEELWERQGEAGSVHQQPWPVADEAALVRERVTLVVQVDGRLRDRIELSADAGADEVRAAVLASEKVQRAIGERAVRDVIVVSGRLANVVTAHGTDHA